MKKSLLTLIMILCIASLPAQISGKLMQYPDVSDSHITFTYGDDVWIASKSGGIANRLSSPAGAESFPRFSPDGKMIAYTANYNGNFDVYVINVNGGIPKRLTYHGMNDRVLGWTPDGKSVLFASSRESGRQRYNQFYTVSVDGGSPEKLSVPYGEYASFSSDGNKIAYTDRSRVSRNWKRYRGGTAPDILIFDLKTYNTENITSNTANDELPMWVGETIYYMSDNGPNKRNNLWKYDSTTKTNTQLTQFKDYDITFPESGKTDIVFEAGGSLYLYNITSGTTNEVDIKIISDQKELIPEIKKVSDYLQDATISPDGNRIVVQARGELFNLPATEGFISNISNTSGVAERSPSWSPDGKHLAYWSDADGEYQLYLSDMEGNAKPKKITKHKNGFYYNIYWSPDSKKVAFVDQAMNIKYIDVESGKTTTVDKGKYMFQGALDNFSVTWSPDSNYFAYSRGTDNRAKRAIFVYDIKNDMAKQLTSGYYSDNSPAFSKDGKHLFFITNRTFQPVYSDMDNTFIYPNSSNIAVATLDNSTESLLEIKNDKFEVKKEEKDKDKKDDDKSKKEDSKDEEKETKIDFDGFESRVELLDIPAGNYGNLQAVEGKLLFNKFPNSGAEQGGSSILNYYDFKERKVKTIISDVFYYLVSANAEKLLVMQNSKLAVIDIGENKKIEKSVPLEDMTMTVIPKEEWKQIFNDVWRFERDFFYDPNMHGVDWQTMRTRYGKLIDQANTRNDVNIIIGDLIAELNASHTYNGGGDSESSKRMNVGYLGADFKINNGAFQISKILEGAAWDAEERSPLAKPGLKIKEGDYILAINGTPLDITKPISAALQGLANTAVQLTVNSSPTMKDAKHIIVKPSGSETRLRHLAWIENNRKRVDEATDGKVGYIYVRSTGIDGQNELVRQFYAQMDKEGMIIDERFNSGGQIPDRFIELLDRKPLAFWAVRDGKDWAWPPSGNFGAKVMLINGFSGSGGDAFPDYFRKRELGPLIGTRTWGGLIGISGAPSLIDGGGVTVPTFRMYDPSGEWFKEGHGVDPDIEVIEDFESLAKGTDAQLEAGIREVMKLLKTNFKDPKRPAYENRN
ncbi:S41 family peptidase [Winogradskyella sp.]|uniref:S41 family peptidase n=1 Tax=Winogradskyella sp. TaxID=1883156 RepID=UPI001B0C3A6F|nr:S41 family peptidase [Winogradskyella sp.]MBO6879075.1 PD40 domain-containing protein [Winogradskyella sp.]